MTEPKDQNTGPEIPAPLNEPAAHVIPCASTIVLEHGIRLTRVGQDLWKYHHGKDSPHVVPLSEILGSLGLKAVKVIIKGASRDHGYILPVATESQLVLKMQLQELSDKRVDARFADHVRNLAYIAEASSYHCNQLIERYLDALDFAKRYGLDHRSEDYLIIGLAHYFEFEALVTVVVRAYETARYPLWAAYGTGNCPRNFEETAKRIRPPEPFPAVATARDTYREAKEYRDCIQHNAHFGARLPFARFHLRQGTAWSVVAWIPDNPRVKSYDKFSYKKRIDALSYGWTLTNRMLEDLHALVQKLPSDSRTAHHIQQ